MQPRYFPAERREARSTLLLPFAVRNARELTRLMLQQLRFQDFFTRFSAWDTDNCQKLAWKQ